MEQRPLQPITQAEASRREKRVAAIARRFGFVGRIQYRHVRADTVSRGLTAVSQEAFASLAGSTVCDNPLDAKALFFKAAHDLCEAGMTTDEAVPMLRRIRQLMREAL